MDKSEMPKVLSDALKNMNPGEAGRVWLWLDSQPYAISEMIELLVTAHKLEG